MKNVLLTILVWLSVKKTRGDVSMDVIRFILAVRVIIDVVIVLREHVHVNLVYVPMVVKTAGMDNCVKENVASVVTARKII